MPPAPSLEPTPATTPLSSLHLPDIPHLHSGKVREIFDLGDSLLLVATDRISAFDHILPNPIPHKGFVLTRLSDFWFHKLDFLPNHLLTTNPAHFPPQLHPHLPLLAGRSMLVRKATPLPVECIVRGYLTGAAWKEYSTSGSVQGTPLPPNLPHAAKLDPPLFTPTSKAHSGHDHPLSWRQFRSLLGDELAHQLRHLSIEIYQHAHDFAASRGILIADSKFEFGLLNGELLLIDELLTPDSSRFWHAHEVHPGAFPQPLDKQFIRNWLEASGWNKQPPPPQLPPEIIHQTSQIYLQLLQALCPSPPHFILEKKTASAEAHPSP